MVAAIGAGLLGLGASALSAEAGSPVAPAAAPPVVHTYAIVPPPPPGTPPSKVRQHRVAVPAISVGKTEASAASDIMRRSVALQALVSLGHGSARWVSADTWAPSGTERGVIVRLQLTPLYVTAWFPQLRFSDSGTPKGAYWEHLSMRGTTHLIVWVDLTSDTVAMIQPYDLGSAATWGVANPDDLPSNSRAGAPARVIS